MTTETLTNTARAQQRMYYQREPMTPVVMEVGQRTRLDGERQWWTVRAAAGQDIVVLTRQAPFRQRGALEYTVLDWRSGVRGPVNVIGQGWRLESVDSDAQCQELADAVHAGQWSVSQRNWLPIVVTDVK